MINNVTICNVFAVFLLLQVEPFDDLAFRGSCGPNYEVCSRLNLRNTTLVFEHSKTNRSEECKKFAEQLVAQLRLKSNMYLHNVVFLPLGDDLVYTTAKEWENEYNNVKKLMNYINTNKQFNVHMQFGTLSQYFGELEKLSIKRRVKFPRVSGDLFPYTRGPKYWSGYFSTRQFMKRLGRELQESVRAAETLMALATPVNIKRAKLSNESISLITKLVHARRELGLFQHHDAITGTSETHVIKDYKQRLSLAYTESQEVMAYLIKSVFENKCDSDRRKETNALENKMCYLSVFPTAFRDDADSLTKKLEIDLQQDESQLVLFNSLTQSRNELVSFEVKHDPDFVIVDINGERIYYDVQKVNNSSIISFIANLSPMSLSLYNLVKTKKYKNYRSDVRMIIPRDDEDIECENNYMSVKFSTKDGSPSMICSKKEFKCRRFEMELINYIMVSDAYTFTNSSKHVKIGNMTRIHKVSGYSYCSVEMYYEFIRIKFLLHRTRGLNGQRLQMDVYDDLSKEGFLGEFALRIKTDIKNKKEFYTDSNGMQLKKRVFRKHLAFGGNIYPMTSMAVIEDNFNRLNVYSTEPHGIVSTKSGWIDITIDRVVVAESDKTVSEFRDNTFDNLPTRTHLFFKFETMENSLNKPQIPENIAPTLDSVLTDDFIQHPVYIFNVLTKFKPKQNTFSFLDHPFPTELSIANMKTLFGDNLEYKGTSLTLFRRFVSSENLRNKSLVYNPKSLFRKGSNTIHFMFNNETVSNNSYVFMPFDLRTFMIQ